MSLKEKINQDLITAMKAKDEATLRTLRMVKSAIMKHEVSGKDVQAGDEKVMEIIQKEAKARKDSVEQFRSGGREDLALKEEEELEVLNKYLPTQLSEEEITAIVKEAIAASGASSQAEIGKVMPLIMPKVKGRADGALVNSLVKTLLSQ